MAKTELVLLAFAAFLLAPGPEASAAGDRREPTNIVYPADAFLHNGGRVIDVTRPPFNAKGDGIADDTKALVAACDFVADKLRGVPWPENTASYVIYLPRGTYLVSDTVVHSGPPVKYPGEGWDGITRLRIVGQSRDGTVVRLRDSCPGFERGSRPVLAFQKGRGTNVPGANQCRNLTVDTGRGNPGATGILFMGANTCAMNDVTIRSRDGQGSVGLDLALFSVQGHMKDITVEGFDYGLRVVPMAECNPVLEHVTLRGQNKAGVLVEEGSPCIRDLWSLNAVPALRLARRAAHVVLVDSLLERGDPASAAIDHAEESSQLFVRNVRTGGYGVAIGGRKGVVPGGLVEEYVSGGVQTLHEGQQKRSLNLPVEDAPHLPWEQDLSRWANPDAFPGADDTQKVQRALDSGATTVYFPRAVYRLGQVRIPPTVRHIEFMYCTINNEASFVVDRPSPEPLWVEHKGGYSRFVIRAPRTLVMHHSGGGYESMHSEPAKVFLESCVNISCEERFCPPGLRVWARSINNEYKHTSNFKVFGGTLWVLGFKTEGAQACFEVARGGVCEVLGGYRNETEEDKGLPMVINEDSHVSFIGYSSMAAVYQQAVWETWKGKTSRLTRTDLPPRLGYKDDFYVPLYVGYGIEPRRVVAPSAAPKELRRAAAAPQEPAVAAVRLPAEEVLRAWDERLAARLREAAAGRLAVAFLLRSLGASARVVSVDGERLVLEVAATGERVTVLRSALSLAEKKSLAGSLAKGGAPEDLAIAAFYALAAGDGDSAREILAQLPPEMALEVRRAFE